MAGLYIHIPFCKQACHYCDFHFSTSQEHRRELIGAIVKELHLQKDYLSSESLNTIYFGGGTPSILNEEELALIFNAIHTSFRLNANPEITLEANPDDLSPDKLTSLRLNGINRLSIGIQSFDDQTLRYLNRAHDSKGAGESVKYARDAGFDNISIDLMYALPGQTAEAWENNIDKALLLSPQHISAYALTIEEKTVFGRWQKNGKLQTPDEEFAAVQFGSLMDRLESAGFEHYEISNFSLPGLHSRHNSAYWNQEMYLGVGPGAHSYDHRSRQWNVSNNPRYTQSLDEGKVPFEREVLSAESKINEYIFTSLRTNRGCDFAKINTDYHRDLLLSNATYITMLKEKQLATLNKETLKLTRAGKFVADRIASDLFTDAVKNA